MKNPSLKVKWSSAACDLSGYASASRNYVHSLLDNNVDVSLDLRSFEPWAPLHLKDEVLGRRLWSIAGSNNSAKVHVIHHTPDQLRDYKDNGLTKVCLFAWETNLIPAHWVLSINDIATEVWVPSQYIKDACIRSGVQKDIYVVPHAIPKVSGDYKPVSAINSIRSSDFNFYSIFQFSERKNPLGLLQAYLEEFSKDESVTLIIKSYRRNDSVEERNYVRRKISQMKRATKGNFSPRILLIEGFLTPMEMTDLHYHGDCCISMTRAEGFGLPIFEAMAFGNPVIAPNYSAFKNFLNTDVSYLIDTEKETAVTGMEHISVLYKNDMVWGEPDIEHCKELMRQVFENRKEARQIGMVGQEFIGKHFSRLAIGKIMKERIEANL